MRVGETEAQNGYSHSTDPGRGSGCSQTCAVVTSPTSPSRTVRMHHECHRATSPHVEKGHSWGQGRGLWKGIRGTAQQPGTITTGDHPLRCQIRSTDGATVPPRCFVRLERASHPERWEAANPKDVQPLAPAC